MAGAGSPTVTSAIVFDVDGTLVDSSYEHVLAWSRAFREVGVDVPGWVLHACMGMGGDRLVAEAAGPAVENAVGDEVRERWRAAYSTLLDDVRPLPDAVETLRELRRRGFGVVLATSGEPDHVERTLEILELTPEEFPVVTSAEVEETKPASDLAALALRRVDASSGLMVGDTTHDVRSGAGAGLPVVGVLTGGITEIQLRAAGAVAVYRDIAALGADLDEVVGLLTAPGS